MGAHLLIFILLLWKQAGVRSVRLIELRVPGHAAAGGEAMLGCQFDTEGDGLYSVKWYKDDYEFYRYVPKDEIPIRVFKIPGVYVDVIRSSSDVVTLVNLERDSSGCYTCEVVGEAPGFQAVFDKKNMTIHVLPQNGPQITGLHHAYRIGDKIFANCTSGASKPESQVKWLLNGRQVQEGHKQGPWYRVGESPDTIETIMQLKLKVKPVHFNRGLLEIKCQATIAPLYQQEVLYRITKIDLPVLSKETEIESETTITTTPTMYEAIGNAEEERNFRKNALYEIRRRLYGRHDFHRPASSSSTTPKPLDDDDDDEVMSRVNQAKPTESGWSINVALTTPSVFYYDPDADLSYSQANSSVSVQASLALFILYNMFVLL